MFRKKNTLWNSGFAFSSILVFAAIIISSVAIIPMAFVANKTNTENRSKAANDNCCGTSGYRSCSTEQDWNDGYYACKRGGCSACGGGSNSSSSSGSNEEHKTEGCPSGKASNCSVTCKDGKSFSDSCPGNGSFNDCPAWEKEACSSHGGIDEDKTGITSETPSTGTKTSSDNNSDSSSNSTICSSGGNTASACYGNTVNSSCTGFNGTCIKNGGLDADGFAVCGCVPHATLPEVPEECTLYGNNCPDSTNDGIKTHLSDCNTYCVDIDGCTCNGICSKNTAHRLQTCGGVDNSSDIESGVINLENEEDISSQNDEGKDGSRPRLTNCNEPCNDPDGCLCSFGCNRNNTHPGLTCEGDDLEALNELSDVGTEVTDKDGKKSFLSNCNQPCDDADGCSCGSLCNAFSTTLYKTCRDYKSTDDTNCREKDQDCSSVIKCCNGLACSQEAGTCQVSSSHTTCYDLHNASNPCKEVVRTSCDDASGYYSSKDSCSDADFIRSSNNQPDSGSTWFGSASFVPCFDINDNCNETKKESCNINSGLYSDVAT